MKRIKIYQNVIDNMQKMYFAKSTKNQGVLYKQIKYFLELLENFEFGDYFLACNEIFEVYFKVFFPTCENRSLPVSIIVIWVVVLKRRAGFQFNYRYLIFGVCCIPPTIFSFAANEVHL